MGAGASRDGEELEVDDRYVSQSQSGSASGHASPRPRSDRRSAGQARKPSRMSMSRNNEGGEIPVIAVMKNGFSVPEVTIMEGQAVVFVWQEDRMDVVQVIHDGEKLRPVIGGFSGSYSNTNGQYEQQFNLEGEYKFALSGIRCTPLLVTVRRRVDLVAELTDAGFQPDIIYIDQGHSIKWQWRDCNSPHSIQEVKYDMTKACFKKDSDSAGTVKTVSGNYRHQFLRPGLYFFMTEGAELGRRHFCAVHVRDTNREFRVEIQDRSYQPMILLIEEGDRVWWSWDKQKCKKHHSVYQIEAPALNQGDDEPYVPVKDGFRWTTPSKQGLMSYEFFKPGVYYYSDQNFQEAAEYIGTIIVKPKQKDLFVELTESGFNPDLVYAQTGDRIWWTWDGQACVNAKKPQLFALMETEACLNPASRKSSAKEGEEAYQYLDDESLALVTKVGLATTHFSTIGVYHYRVADSPDTLNTCSVIVNPGPKNHTIHLTDNGFEPKVITVRPNDRVWWVWQSGRKQHNILQVSHQGVPIENGFCSGAFRDAPSAFVHQFMTPGVFYFLSHSLPKLFGAIVVSTQPQVHEVNVGVDIKPDPVAVKMNDIVCWIFRSLRQYGVSRVQSIDQIASNEVDETTVPPRRCMSKAITRSGVQHFYSRSFTKGKKEKENFIDDIKISSVVCDERYDNAVVRIDSNGFHPAVYYIQKSQSVMWVWKGSEDEAHNVIHVKSPDSDEPLNVIHGAKSFNSGKPVPNNSFLYTFDEDGSYTVASQGAPGFFCTIVVLDVGMRVKEPFIDSPVTGGTVDAGTKILLSCETPGSRIYYTTDGSPPELHQESVKLYRPENGVVIRRPGLQFIRAMATKEGRLNSHIYTSNRFWVMGDGDDRSVSSEMSAREAKHAPRTSAKTWDWWGCIPAIKACFTNPGTLEVFWDPPESGHLSLIKGYQLYLNGVSYCDMFPPTNNSLRVSGMAGGRTYDVLVEVYSKKPDCQPQKSNKLRMKCPLVTSDGGPVISLERSDKSDTLAIVWMSIDTPQNPISGYLVFLNDQQCGKRLVPDPESNRCKVVIGSCETEKPYKVYVVAIPAGNQMFCC